MRFKGINLGYCMLMTGLLLLGCKKETAHNSKPSYGIVTDIEGNVYKTVIIGKQTWMAENLKVVHYRNGDLIPTTVPTARTFWGETSPKYQWVYADVDFNYLSYGRLYTWDAVNDSRNVCPEGWHIPTDTDWTTLIDYLHGDSIAGGKLMEDGSGHWLLANPSPDVNETGFSGLPGGYMENGTYSSIRLNGFWWTSTATNSINAWSYSLKYRDSHIYRIESYKSMGFSVRCVKD
jgi:Fibrobacter succinogenes major domain (Fib_succ_major).